jgi:hypothetical protein
VKGQQGGAISEKRLNKLVARIRAEKEEWDASDFERGKQRGIEYAARASYFDLVDYQRQFEALSDAEGSEEQDGFALPQAEKALLDERLRERRVADPDVYLAGWVEGVMDVCMRVVWRIGDR